MTVVMTRDVKVDVVRPGDRGALVALFAGCSEATIVSRFFAPLRAFPGRYLDSALAGPPRRHDALVLRYGDGLHVAGLGSLVLDPSSGCTGELGVLVADRWQRQGLGRALVAALLDRAGERGVEEVTASVLPARAGLLRALARRLPVVSIVRDDAYLTGRYRLDEWEVRDGRP